MNYFAFVIGFAFIAYRFAHGGDVCCDQYTVKVSGIKSWDKNNAILSPTINATLTKNCTAELEACITVNRPFTDAKISFDVVAGGFLTIFSAKNEDVCTVVKKLQIPVDCPVTIPGTYCVTKDNPVDVSEFKQYLGAAACAGDVSVKNVKVVYDGKSTDTFSLTLTIKAKK